MAVVCSYLVFIFCIKLWFMYLASTSHGEEDGRLARECVDGVVNWVGSIWRATWKPFVVVLILSWAFGNWAHLAHPNATRLADIYW